ncbi:MAG: ankyrin repeat domain-containing protein [Tunicatimonas sp.]|uniref:ankyrin repeat domain-containing protein n=1 Tax=Tunicatimonas sp. TaxID=1940096 RepID=UPI003C72A830
MENARQNKIEDLACEGKLVELKTLIECGFSQAEIDTALVNAIAYSQISTAKYLLSLGADIFAHGCNGLYYAVHNNELEGVKFSISKGIDINTDNGMPINTSIFTSTNSGNTEITKWLIKNGADPKLLTVESLRIAKQYGTGDLKSLLKQYLPLKFTLS